MVVRTLGIPKILTLIILKRFTAHCLCTQFGFGLHYKFFITNRYALGPFCIPSVRTIVWRIVKAHVADRAFTGEGARRYGGRWNSKGYAVVYTSSSISLAILEVPSAIVPTEKNYLINPAHSNFGKLKIGSPTKFEFDPRLIKS